MYPVSGWKGSVCMDSNATALVSVLSAREKKSQCWVLKPSITQKPTQSHKAYMKVQLSTKESSEIIICTKGI